MKLHFGCGGNYIDGWVNVERDKKYDADIYADLSKPFPWDDNSIEAIISQHFIEHLTESEGALHFEECYRVLKPNGLIRISCPDLYQEALWYIEFKKKNKPYIGSVESDAYISTAKSFNVNWTNWGHRYNYDFEDLSVRLGSVGFKNIIRKSYSDMSPIFVGVEKKRAECLCVEAMKE